MPLANVNGTNLYYELHGPEGADGAPSVDAIVLSNGIFMSTASWGFQLAALKKHFRVLLYDCRGMWQSEHPAGPYALEQHADDLAGLLGALDIKFAHIAGISYGGEISMVFAAKYPALCRSLIVSSAVSQIDPLLAAVGKSWMDALVARDAQLLFDVTVPYNFSEDWIRKNAALLEASRKRYDLLDFTSYAALMDAFMRLDITPSLGKITCPALVMVGENDILKPRKYAEIIARNITGAELAILPHAGHAACMEQPGVFNSLVIGFAAKYSEAMA